MGKSITPKYRIEYRSNLLKYGLASIVWNYGRANRKNLEAWRIRFNESFLIGGVNGHVSKHAGYIVHVDYARIVNQKTGDIVAETKAPMFEVL